MISFDEGSDQGWQILSISIKNKDYLADFVAKSSDDLRDRIKPSNSSAIQPKLSFSTTTNTIDIIA